MYLDPLYVIMILPALLLAIYAQIRVKVAFGRYSRVATTTGLTGAMAARKILNAFGLHDVAIEVSGGWLSDHYDPGKRVLRLSPDVYRMNSVAAVGIAAHEAGHALQHAAGYAPLRFRNAIVPTAQVGSWLAFPMIIGGYFLALKGLALAGLLLFGLIVLFQMVTLPVEFNASRRAKEVIANLGVIQTAEEGHGVSAVLNAAALTYVAATVTAIMQLLYWAMRLGLLGGRRD